MNKEILAKAATVARGLAIDAVAQAKSGHLGLPLGCAELGAVLFGELLSYNPAEPRWINRDRFILSAGHGSMFLYTWLHLAGYELSRDDIKAFRQLHSKTPGHPEFRETPGVESTTGPLGQGVGNAVGFAVSLKRAAARYNTDLHTIFDSHVICLAGDGCMQEGVAREAAAFAGHFKLDNLILIYDSNDVTLDAQADQTQSEDACAVYAALGFDVVQINGHDFDAIASAVRAAKANDNGRPKLIEIKTVVGRGIPEVAGTWKAHGEAGNEYSEAARIQLGLPEERFYVSEEVQGYFATVRQRLQHEFSEWGTLFDQWKAANPELATELQAVIDGIVPSAEEILAEIPAFTEEKLASRAAGGAVLQPISEAYPRVMTGSADLFGSTKNYLKAGGDFTPATPEGRNIRFGIREHAMGAIVNGLAYDGIWQASGATFLTFSDYMRASIRLAALSGLRAFHIFTHDSVGVGEDGPTHQPVETVSSLRLIPNLDVIRPGDAEETAGAFAAALSRQEGPTAIILSRQGLPTLNLIPVEHRRMGVLKGGYIARQESADLHAIILAAGSELQHAMAAAEELGDGVRVVSLPCFERFNRQDPEYQASVLPPHCRVRVAIEAGVTPVWAQYVGLDGRIVGINRFGLSAPGGEVMKELGITKDAVVEAVRDLLG